MLNLRILFLLIPFILFTSNAFSAGSIIDAYNSMDESEKLIFDTILEEFKTDHFVFIGEKSTPKTLLLAFGVPFNPDADKSHDESDGHDHKHDEKLNVAMVRATDKDAELNSNLIITIGPYKLTYKELYVVNLSEKNITFTVTTDESEVDGRKPGVPDSKIIERIASRLKGTIQVSSTIALP
jgi:hypothetical protein